MRCVRSLFLIGVCSVAIASANSVTPSLVWTEDAVGSLDISTGMQAIANCDSDINICSTTRDDSRSFTVLSPGEFVLTTAVTVSAEASSYSIGLGYLPIGEVSANMIAFSTVAGPDNIVQDSYDSGSNTCIPQQQDGPPACLVFLGFNDSQSEILDLGVGNYVLSGNYTVTAGGSLPAAYSTIDTTIVPTPEPTSCSILLTVAFCLALPIRMAGMMKARALYRKAIWFACRGTIA